MFENYVGAKRRKRPKWVGLLIAASVAVHSVAGAALIVRSLWVIAKLTPPETRPILSLGPPPPPPPPKGKKKTSTLKDQLRRKKITDTVQPEETPEEITPDEMAGADDDTEGEDFGVEGGVEGGVAGGVVGGVLGGVPGGTGVAPPPPPPEQKPQVVPQVVLKEYRISGEKDIGPPDAVKNLMVKQGESKTVSTVKMCLTKGGSVKSLRMLKSSGYQEYDSKIQRKMKQWKYRPFKVNGKAVPVCTSVTFIYRQT